MKPANKIIYAAFFLVLIFGGFFLYKKFSFSEEMAKEYAKKFFNILTIKGNYKEFEEMYPSFGSGSRIVTPALCKINSVTKRSDGDFDIYAVYEASKILNYPIYIVINRKGEVVTSRGVSYAYYDKTLDYAKKIGCLTGTENDSEIESIIKRKDLRRNLNLLADAEWFLIENGKVKITSNLSNNWGYSYSGDAVVENKTSIAFDYGDLKCSIQFLSSSGEIIGTEDVFVTNLPPYGSVSSSIFSTATSASKVKYVVKLNNSEYLKNKIKEYIINTTTDSCF
jgi:hypothetical protein